MLECQRVTGFLMFDPVSMEILHYCGPIKHKLNMDQKGKKAHSLKRRSSTSSLLGVGELWPLSGESIDSQKVWRWPFLKHNSWDKAEIYFILLYIVLYCVIFLAWRTDWKQSSTDVQSDFFRNLGFFCCHLGVYLGPSYKDVKARLREDPRLTLPSCAQEHN